MRSRTDDTAGASSLATAALLCAVMTMTGCAGQGTSRQPEAAPPVAHDASAPAPVTVRYQVTDVGRAVDFYTRHLGFSLEQRAGTAFASVTREGLMLLLSGPGSSGSRPMPDGRRQEPGGWNRIVLYVDDLDSRIEALRQAGVRFRNPQEPDRERTWRPADSDRRP